MTLVVVLAATNQTTLLSQVVENVFNIDTFMVVTLKVVKLSVLTTTKSMAPDEEIMLFYVYQYNSY